MTDLTHLNALELHLSHERVRLSHAKSSSERALRTVWVEQLQREIDAEYAFLGLTKAEGEISDTDLEEILADI